MTQIQQTVYKDRKFSPEEIAEIQELVETFGRLSRTELAATICENFDWKRANGSLKTLECRHYLEKLEATGHLRLPAAKARRPKGSKTRVLRTEQAEKGRQLQGDASRLKPIQLKKVETKSERDLWYEYVDRYHYLGYQLPYGAQLRYFIQSEAAGGQVLGCMQFSSSAWKMAPRDRWIGWQEQERKQNLQKIVNQSRFLILPWIEIKNLASMALALAARTIAGDWEKSFGYRPVLLESLVDSGRFNGTCYQAANWIYVGKTTGRGRMDRFHRKEDRVPKKIYLYPLDRRFREILQKT